MKPILLSLCLMFWTAQALAETVKLAVTTSFENAGLADVLLPAIAKETGIDLQLLVVGTGQALRLAQAGDVDAVLVHAEAAEQAFVAAGHATHRRPIMYNDFVLIGPRADPAGIAQATTASDALARIAAQAAPFVSRGDDSGTHKAELALWPSPPTGDWYLETGSGMGAALNTASGLGAYVLSDRASWLNHGNPGDLMLLFAGDPALFNQYSLLPVNPARHPHVAAAATARLEDWLTSPRAAALINGYRIKGEALFTFNATP